MENPVQVIRSVRGTGFISSIPISASGEALLGWQFGPDRVGQLHNLDKITNFFTSLEYSVSSRERATLSPAWSSLAASC